LKYRGTSHESHSQSLPCEKGAFFELQKCANSKLVLCISFLFFGGSLLP
jgi:hypothetical protein